LSNYTLQTTSFTNNIFPLISLSRLVYFFHDAGFGEVL